MYPVTFALYQEAIWASPGLRPGQALGYRGVVLGKVACVGGRPWPLIYQLFPFIPVGVFHCVGKVRSRWSGVLGLSKIALVAQVRRGWGS